MLNKKKIGKYLQKRSFFIRKRLGKLIFIFTIDWDTFFFNNGVLKFLLKLSQNSLNKKENKYEQK